MILPTLEMIAEDTLRGFERKDKGSDQGALRVLEFGFRYERIAHRADFGEQVAKRRLCDVRPDARLSRPCPDVRCRSEETTDTVGVALFLTEVPEQAAHHTADNAVGDRELIVVRARSRHSLRSDVKSCLHGA